MAFKQIMQLIVAAKSTGAADLKRVQQNLRNTGRAGRTGAQQTSAAWKTAALAVGSVAVATVALKRAFDFAKEGEKIRNVAVAFQELNADAAGTLAELDDAFRGTMDVTSMQVFANQMRLLGIDTKRMGEISSIAFKAAATTGKDFGEVMKVMTTAMGTMRPQTLAQFGIMVSLKTAQEEYAEQLGVTVSQLDETAKREAFLTKAIKEGNQAFQDLDVEKLNTNLSQTQKILDDMVSDVTELAGVIGSQLVVRADSLSTTMANLALWVGGVRTSMNEVTRDTAYVEAISDAARQHEAAAEAARLHAKFIEQVAEAMQLGRVEYLDQDKTLAALKELRRDFLSLDELSLSQLTERKKKLDELEPSIRRLIEQMGLESEKARELQANLNDDIRRTQELIVESKKAKAALAGMSDVLGAASKGVAMLTSATGNLRYEFGQLLDRSNELTDSGIVAFFLAASQMAGGYARTILKAFEEHERGGAGAVETVKAMTEAEFELTKAIATETDERKRLHMEAMEARNAVIRELKDGEKLSFEERAELFRVNQELMTSLRRVEAEEQKALADAEKARLKEVDRVRAENARREKQAAADALRDEQALANFRAQQLVNTASTIAQADQLRTAQYSVADSTMAAARAYQDYTRAVQAGGAAEKAAIPGTIAAAGIFAGAWMKSVKALAVVRGLFEAAASVASFVVGDVRGGAGHALASAKFFSVAGAAKSGGGATSGAGGGVAAGGAVPASNIPPRTEGATGGAPQVPVVININSRFIAKPHELSEELADTLNLGAGIINLDPRLVGAGRQD